MWHLSFSVWLLCFLCVIISRPIHVAVCSFAWPVSIVWHWLSEDSLWPGAESLDTLTQSRWPADPGKQHTAQSPIFSSQQGGVDTEGLGKRKDLPAKQETQVRSLGREDPLEEEMATHSKVLNWKTPWTEEPGRLQSWGRKEAVTTEHAHTVWEPLA